MVLGQGEGATPFKVVDDAELTLAQLQCDNLIVLRMNSRVDIDRLARVSGSFPRVDRSRIVTVSTSAVDIRMTRPEATRRYPSA